MLTYDETNSIEDARQRAQDLSAALPGTPGIIGVGHPELRESLAKAAERRGATVRRGARVVGVSPGPSPSVAYEIDGETHTAACRVVVVADGKDTRRPDAP